MIKTLIDLAEKGIMPDFLIRSGIRSCLLYTSDAADEE